MSSRNYPQKLVVTCRGCGQRFTSPDPIEADRRLQRHGTLYEAGIPAAAELLALHMCRSKGCYRDYAELEELVSFLDWRVIPASLHLIRIIRGCAVRGITWPDERLRILQVSMIGIKGCYKRARSENEARQEGLDLIRELRGRVGELTAKKTEN